MVLIIIKVGLGTACTSTFALKQTLSVPAMERSFRGVVGPHVSAWSLKQGEEWLFISWVPQAGVCFGWLSLLVTGM